MSAAAAPFGARSWPIHNSCLLIIRVLVDRSDRLSSALVNKEVM